MSLASLSSRSCGRGPALRPTEWRRMHASDVNRDERCVLRAGGARRSRLCSWYAAILQLSDMQAAPVCLLRDSSSQSRSVSRSSRELQSRSTRARSLQRLPCWGVPAQSRWRRAWWRCERAHATDQLAPNDSLLACEHLACEHLAKHAHLGYRFLSPTACCDAGHHQRRV